MIAVSGGLKVLVATKPIDFRKGMDGLAALVKAHLGGSLCCDTAAA
jgi:transposase